MSSVMFSLLGVSAGLLANSTPTLSLFNSIIILPMSFMCGTLFDVSSLPEIVSYIVWALPLSHTTSVLRDAASGSAIDPVSVTMIIAYAAIFYAICYIVIRKKLY